MQQQYNITINTEYWWARRTLVADLSFVNTAWIVFQNMMMICSKHDNDDWFADEKASAKPREEADECVHGVANSSQAEDHCWEPRLTQRWNL